MRGGFLRGATVCVLPGQMCDRGNTGVVKTESETGDDELRKKTTTKKDGCASLDAQPLSGHLSRQHRPNGAQLWGVQGRR